MHKKAQAAMEFLMTYGWAIMVVLAAIGALSYFGVLDMSNLLPERCHFPTGFECVGRAAIDANTDTVRFILQNDYGSKIELASGSTDTDGDCSGGTVEFCAGTGCTTGFSPTLELSNNQRATVRLNCTSGFSEGRFRVDVTVNYNDTLTGFPFSVKGQIRGKAME